MLYLQSLSLAGESTGLPPLLKIKQIYILISINEDNINPNHSRPFSNTSLIASSNFGSSVYRMFITDEKTKLVAL